MSPVLRRPLHWAVPILPVLLGVLLLSSAVEDDAYITYWPAHTLATQGEILNYNGERVEQSSTLAFVVLLAGLARLLPLEIPLLAPLVSAACAMLVVVLTRTLAMRLDPRLATSASLLAATWTGLLVWGLSGMETTLQAALAAAFVLLLGPCLGGKGRVRTWSGLLIVTLLFQATRPEALYLPVVVIGALVLVGMGRRRGGAGEDAQATTWHPWLGALAITFVGLLVLFVFRTWYFGDRLPQPAAAKVSGLSWDAALRGATYVVRHAFLRIDGGAWIVAACVLVVACARFLRGRTADLRWAVILSFLGTHVGFVVLSGGDWLHQGRFLVAVLPMVAVLCAWALQAWSEPRRRRVLVGLLVGLQVVGVLTFARSGSFAGPLWSAAHLDGSAVPGNFFELRRRDLYHDRVLGTRLHEILAAVERSGLERVTVLSGQMGVVAFDAARARATPDAASPGMRVRFIDRWGLCTRDFTACEVTAGRRRFPMGIHVSFDFFFDHLSEFESRCGIPRPDIVWDWTGEVRGLESLRRRGYRIVYEQDGWVRNGSRLLPGCRVRAKEFIAVRNDLLSVEALPSAVFSFGP